MSWLLGGRRLSRVLVTRLRYLGDVVMATAVVEALRRGDERLEIGFLCEEAYAPVLAGYPPLSRIHALGVRRHGGDARARADRGPRAGRGTLAMVRELRQARYDAAVDLFFNPRSAWLLRLAGIPARLAGPAGGRSRLYTHCNAPGTATWPGELARLAPGGLGDHLSRLAPLVHAESGLPFGAWFAREGVRATTRLAPRGSGAAEPRPLLLAPGATWPTKRWPPEHWRELASLLAARQGRPVRVIAPPGGAALAAAVAEGASAAGVRALPELGLPEILDRLAGAAGLVTVDGGIMHAAVALQVPTLALFGPTDPGLWFPYGNSGPYRVLATRPTCHPCDLHACPAFVCLPDLRPGTVADAALDLFGSGSER